MLKQLTLSENTNQKLKPQGTLRIKLYIFQSGYSTNATKREPMLENYEFVSRLHNLGILEKNEQC